MMNRSGYFTIGPDGEAREASREEWAKLMEDGARRCLKRTRSMT
jgi:hypothetical protein